MRRVSSYLKKVKANSLNRYLWIKKFSQTNASYLLYNSVMGKYHMLFRESLASDKGEIFNAVACLNILFIFLAKKERKELKKNHRFFIERTSEEMGKAEQNRWIVLTARGIKSTLGGARWSFGAKALLRSNFVRRCENILGWYKSVSRNTSGSRNFLLEYASRNKH